MPGDDLVSEPCILSLLAAGTIAEADVDRAVGNVLRKKFASGLFDAPFAGVDAAGVNPPAHVALARRAAAASTVLLINENKTLPIREAEVKARRVVVVGPFGDGDDARTAMLGGYTPGIPTQTRVATLVEALRARGFGDVQYVMGSGGGRDGPPSQGDAGLAAAAAAVHNASLVLVAVGTVSCSCCARCGNGEVGDRSSLDFEDRQLELLSTVLAAARASPAQPAVVTVVISGRPVTFGPPSLMADGRAPLFNPVLEAMPALLHAGRPGEQGAAGILDVVFGVVNPSARLAQAWVRSAGYLNGPSSPWFQTPSR